jgi:hypothetical protein
LGFDCLISSAAFGIEELQQFLECYGVGRVPQKGAFTTHVHELFILQLLQMVRKRGIWNVQLGLDIAYDQTVGMSRKEQLHDSKAWFGAHCGKHVGVLCDLLGTFPGRGYKHDSILAEIWIAVKSGSLVCDGGGVPLAIQLTGANRNDSQQAFALLVDAISSLQGERGTPGHRPDCVSR